MSVQTTADKHLEDAQQHIRDAITALMHIIVEQCYGHDEFQESYRVKMREAFETLIRLRESLS